MDVGIAGATALTLASQPGWKDARMQRVGDSLILDGEKCWRRWSGVFDLDVGAEHLLLAHVKGFGQGRYVLALSQVDAAQVGQRGAADDAGVAGGIDQKLIMR